MGSEGNDKADIAKAKGSVAAEIGAAGLVQYGGYVQEEFLRELTGTNARKTYAEMMANDSVISGIFHGIEQLVRQVEWTTNPVDDSAEAKKWAEVVSGALDDMSYSWEDTLAQVVSFIPYGFHFAEIVYKFRKGDKDDGSSSQYDDGLIGWRKFAGRAQNTLLRWEFDDKTGAVSAFVQYLPGGKNAIIPIDRGLLFRTTTHKDNPEGKALDPSTPVPTPDGWTTMGELQDGDAVYDDHGRVCYVVATQNWANRPRSRVEFADGTSIVADDAHEWKTATLHERTKAKRWETRTTEQMAHPRSQNLAVPVAAPICGTKRWLPVHPYVLGLWLGDGTHTDSVITTHVDDIWEQVGRVEECGYEITKVTETGRTDSDNARQFRIGSDCRRAFRLLGVFGDKHVPQTYLRAPREDRLALLRGLMDSDGTVDLHGRITFSNTNLSLVHGVAELVRSLGCSARIYLHKKAGEGRGRHERTRDSWRVSFQPHDFNPFWLERKAERVRKDEDKRHSYHHQYVRHVVPLEPGPTVCIQVDSLSHLFLAGEGMVPSHNSMLRSMYPAYKRKNRIQDHEAIGIERDLAGLPMALAPVELFSASATNEQKSALAEIKKQLERVRMNEQGSMVVPAAYDEAGHPLYDFKLVTTGGARQFTTDTIVSRYNQQMAMAMLADFLLLGHEGVGSQSLGISKIQLFTLSLQAYVDSVAGVFNQYAIPRLLKLNGADPALSPHIEPSKIEQTDVAGLGTFVQAISAAGVMMTDEETQNYLRRVGGMPELASTPGGGDSMPTPKANADGTPTPGDTPPNAADQAAADKAKAQVAAKVRKARADRVRARARQ